MSLIDDLRAAATSVPPSHVPTAHELPGVLGALILHLEHGDFLAAAENGVEAVTDVISPPQPEPEPEPDRSAEIAQLQAQVAALQGAAGHPTVTVEQPSPENASSTEPVQPAASALPTSGSPAEPGQGPV